MTAALIRRPELAKVEWFAAGLKLPQGAIAPGGRESYGQLSVVEMII
ncbi:hypothetical protein WKW80_16170 [Variovorax humicola]|uniref:Uncharacterized protein n=1 Tax=Variovorax humicola TaxID=1769758 RepID=A0ABU8W0G4_9BURK